MATKTLSPWSYRFLEGSVGPDRGLSQPQLSLKNHVWLLGYCFASQGSCLREIFISKECPFLCVLLLASRVTRPLHSPCLPSVCKHHRATA